MHAKVNGLRYACLRRRDFMQSDTENTSHLELVDKFEASGNNFVMMFNVDDSSPVPALLQRRLQLWVASCCCGESVRSCLLGRVFVLVPH